MNVSQKWQKWKKSKKRIFEIIQIGNREDLPSRMFDIFIVVAIFANIAVLLLSTFDQLSAYQGLFTAIEIVTIVIFCVEYALRIWTADLLYPDKNRARSVLRFLFSFDGIVDLLTILPFFFLSGMGAIRFLRVARIFHLFRINTQYESFQVITSVIKEKRNAILYSVFIIIVLILAASLTMYSVEHNAQPEAFENAFSGIWWSVSTVFTVGYGDIYPITTLGRVLGVIITFLGVGAVAIPTGILSAGFVEHYSRMQKSPAATDYKSSSAVILADEASSYTSRTVKEAEELNNVCVTALIRGELVIVPDDPVKIEKGDVLVITKL
ncbi:MAG: ion transporter [Lachnospiraceae bacterium]|nr:ion transporter [Lachnospiraceae bacterium]